MLALLMAQSDAPSLGGASLIAIIFTALVSLVNAIISRGNEHRLTRLETKLDLLPCKECPLCSDCQSEHEREMQRRKKRGWSTDKREFE